MNIATQFYFVDDVIVTGSAELEEVENNSLQAPSETENNR